MVPSTWPLVRDTFLRPDFGMWVCHTRRWHAGGQICLCVCVRSDNNLFDRLVLNMSMKTVQRALTFIYRWLIAVVKLTHKFKEQINVIDSFSCKMPEIHFETLWILKMTKRIWKNFLTLDILSRLQYLRGGSVPLYWPPSKNLRWTARGRTWGSPPFSRRTSTILLFATLSKCQYPG